MTKTGGLQQRQNADDAFLAQALLCAIVHDVNRSIDAPH
jgi:hypothetical protein